MRNFFQYTQFSGGKQWYGVEAEAAGMRGAK
jgi:hypothetical protein